MKKIKDFELINSFVDGECSYNEFAQAQKLIESCEVCKSIYEDINSIIDLESELELVEPPIDLKSNIMNAVETEKTYGKGNFIFLDTAARLFGKFQYKLAAGFVACAFLIAVFLSFNNSKTPETTTIAIKPEIKINNKINPRQTPNRNNIVAKSNEMTTLSNSRHRTLKLSNHSKKRFQVASAKISGFGKSVIKLKKAVKHSKPNVIVPETVAEVQPVVEKTTEVAVTPNTGINTNVNAAEVKAAKDQEKFTKVAAVISTKNSTEEKIKDFKSTLTVQKPVAIQFVSIKF